MTRRAKKTPDPLSLHSLPPPHSEEGEIRRSKNLELPCPWEFFLDLPFCSSWTFALRAGDLCQRLYSMKAWRLKWTGSLTLESCAVENSFLLWCSLSLSLFLPPPPYVCVCARMDIHNCHGSQEHSEDLWYMVLTFHHVGP